MVLDHPLTRLGTAESLQAQAIYKSSYGSSLTAETKKVRVMEKLAQDLKRGFLNLFEAIRGSRTSQGNENGDEATSESVEEVTVQDRGVKVTARGPKRPGVPKGPPPKNA
ncbi:hypothetical protein POPTR_005G084100v4 [Populus trichocarpa]|uniref:Uncharacterized protein n=1 Tax=Populus trichocarpa TaxID=3694 RepID=U5GBC1_POPTR|nr:uncharacterized protein LOC18099067 [Populus trichocarpa]PNT35617.1 hypothetical protein POPTR_005G084100v4 [Populus trichocarpa]|eukprot:XP_006382928.1 uncharacterized protein LOC18099067 [Populus trichocarpa]